MLYGDLVARISEVTRALVDRGNMGEHLAGSDQFRARQVMPEEVRPGCLLRLGGENSPETYKILEVDRFVGRLTLDREFKFPRQNLSWEVFTPGVSESDVRAVLQAFPDVIMECEEGEYVKTYLGTFRLTRRKKKRVKDPQGRWTFSEEKIVARIRPGKRLQRDVNGPSEDPDTSPDDPEGSEG